MRKQPCGAGQEVRYYLQTAHGCLTVIRLSTTEITGPWLSQAMAPRIASTLNYFLLHLTGVPGRRWLQNTLNVLCDAKSEFVNRIHIACEV